MEAKNMALSEHALRRHSYYGILALLALVGLVAIGVRLTEGMRVTALSSPMAWGMWVAFYIYRAFGRLLPPLHSHLCIWHAPVREGGAHGAALGAVCTGRRHALCVD
jgi:hypothetical protein